jgi:uncharacterized protein (TIGR03663 family)
MVKRQLLFPALILLVAAVVRLAFLDIKPPHFDEGINGWFCDQMGKHGYYSYDPTNYHGPLHFYVLFVSLKLLGRNLWALRLPTVLVSIVTIYWVCLFRRFFGKTIAYLAALGMALSPGFIFYNRYSIHESWLILFMVISFWGFLGIWNSRQPRYIWAIILGAAGMILTKETYVIHIGAAAVTIGILLSLHPVRPHRFSLWQTSSNTIGDDQRRSATQASSLNFLRPEVRIGDPATKRHVFAASAVAIFLILFFYSGTFLNLKAFFGVFEALLPWTKTGVDANGHGKFDYDLFPLLPRILTHLPFLHSFASFKMNWYWVSLMTEYEWFALLGLLASVPMLFSKRGEFRFLSIYGLLVLFVYSVIPYKTPWCIISVLWPFMFLAAGALDWLGERLHWSVAVVATISLLGYSAVKDYRLNFVRFDDEGERYAYVQTFRDFYKFVDPVLEEPKHGPKDAKHLNGTILLSSSFPIPWELGDFKNVGYYTSEEQWPDDLSGADFIAVETSLAPELEKELSDSYYVIDFRLRPGLGDCRGYFRQKTFAGILPPQTPRFEPAKPKE